MDPNRLAFDAGLALVRVVETVKDVHQRRLAGPVLTEESVYLTPAQVEIDAVIRCNPGESLRDPAELENRRPFSHARVILGAGGCPPLGSVLVSLRRRRNDLAVSDQLGDSGDLRGAELPVSLRALLAQFRVGDAG